jgi:hypothetical protein
MKKTKQNNFKILLLNDIFDLKAFLLMNQYNNDQSMVINMLVLIETKIKILEENKTEKSIYLLIEMINSFV